MRKYRQDIIPEHTVSNLDVIICDKCKREIDAHDPRGADRVHSIEFVAAGDSPFGDGNQIDCDLCEACLYGLIHDCLRIVARY